MLHLFTTCVFLNGKEKWRCPTENETFLCFLKPDSHVRCQTLLLHVILYLVLQCSPVPLSSMLMSDFGASHVKEGHTHSRISPLGL